MAGFLCILWILSNIFSPGDGIRIVTAMTPNGSLDPLKIHCETRKTVTASRVPEPSEGCILGDFYQQSIKHPAKSSKNLQQKTPGWMCFFG